MTKDYYLGLDMGTSSVGWAITDEDYNLLRAKGKDLWGVRLFSEAETSADRRVHRTSRRRLQREKARIGYLRKLFAEEINKIDKGFYQRLDDSKYHEDDKQYKQPFALFADTGFTDKEYYEKYPTIFHLRKALIESDEKQDVRLIFLAILNMFKHRGHFLNANLDGDGIENIEELMFDLKNNLLETCNLDLTKKLSSETLQELLPSKKYSNSRKVEEILKISEISKSKDKSITEMLKLICGLQGKVSVIFENEDFDEEGKKFAFSFRDGNFEEKMIQMEELLSDEEFEIIMNLKQIHDWGILANIMKGKEKTYKYLSEARVAIYDKHKQDLKILKNLFKEYNPDKYDDIFRIMEDDNYSAYVGSVNSGKETIRRGAKSNNEEFFKKIKKLVSDMPDCEDKEYVLNEIETENFLPKQLTASNGVIPNQVHKAELKAILSKAETYLDFLKEKDDTGLTVSEKILKLFEFQIPYYIGPLVNKGNGNAWVIRKEYGEVLPWNFEQKIDVKKSAEEFINKMVNHCTYINGENVLPKNSLLYEKFMVLNELNNLKINGEKISPELKQNLFNDLFRKGKKIKSTHIKNYLKANGIIDNCDTVDISGIDGDFTNTLANYAKFTSIHGVETLTYEQEKMSEQIIFWSTIYGDSKKFLKEKIEESYGKVLSKEQIKRILGFKFKDWGRLSKEFLETEGADKETGEIATIISRMWNENYNLMELLSGKFTYLEAIEKKTKKIEKTLTEIEYEDLNELYISAPVKRMTWQTILILKELYNVLGNEPKKIFVEMARDVNSKEKRKDSRKKKFLDLYKSCKEDGRNWSDEINKKDESDFKSKKLYLYYTQKGRCMYTGEIIELSDLVNDNLYDIDHIYPQHFVKDDSIENNLVLVKKEKNAHKSDNYPIESEIRQKRFAWWKSLQEGGFITKQKFERLISSTEFTDDERAAFISRQIVETRQGTKVITNLFEKTFKNTEIVYVKAGNVSLFREQFKLLKCREVNDFHHANDAYLNIVVGNTYNLKFTKNPINFIKEYKKAPKKNEYHMYKLFEHTVQRNGIVAWNTACDKSISIVRKVMNKNTPLVTRMNYEEHGGLADQTIYSAAEAKNAKGIGYIPVKASDERLSDVSKYGGYKKYTGAYFFLVEHTLKGKRIRTLEAMPLYLKDKLDSEQEMEKYCINVLGYEAPSIRMKKIKMYSLIKVNGFYLYLSGRSNNKLLVHNAVEMIMDYNDILYIRNISKLNGIKIDDRTFEKYKISKEENLRVYDVLTDKHTRTIYNKRPNYIGEKLINDREKFINLDIEKQIYVLVQIVQLSKLSNMGADLQYLGEAKKTGVMNFSKKISEKEEFKLINQSVTGLFENEIDLLKV